MADTNLVKFAAVEEGTWGTTPASAGQLINITAPQIRRARTRNTPNVIRGDRRNYAPVILQENGTCAVSAPLQYENFALFMEGVLGGDRSADLAISAATISFTSATGTIADSGNGLGGIQVGDYIFVAGATNGGNNGRKGPVATAAAGSITVPVAQITDDEAAGATVTIKGMRLLDGSTAKSYSVQEDYSVAVSNNFRSEKGARVDSYSVSWQSGQFPTETFNLVGLSPVFGNATVFTGADLAAPTFSYMNPLGNFVELFVDGTATTMIISALTLNVGAGADPGYGVGSSTGPVLIGQNKIVPSGTLRVYFDAAARTVADLADADTTASLRWTVTDAEGNFRIYALPSVKLDAEMDVGGPDQRIFTDFAFTAFENTTYDYQIGIFELTA